MKRQKIELTGNIDKIYHLADIHIRNLQRHKEYKEVFKRLYTYIETTKTENSVIVLAGDIVHAKTDMTPEVIDMTQTFLSTLSDLCHTILIPGNHDANLNNISRLDALSPVVNALNHPNLYYLKEDAVLDMGGITFIHTSIFNESGEILKADDYSGDYKVALYHGAVDTVQTEHGFTLSNSNVNVESFKGYDLTLLGDIHVPNQSLNKEGTLKYCGSLIVQNHGEAKYPNHGLLVWDVKTKKSEFVPIKNDYGYVTITVENGVVIGDPIIPKKPRIRIMASETTQTQLKEITSELRNGRTVQEVTIHKTTNGVSTEGRSIHLENVRDIAFQNKLITNYLQNTHTLSDKLINTILDINKDINKKLGLDYSLKNIIWKPKRFEFSNMFSYGEDNVVDFTNMKGAYGIFAGNASGKSSLWDALSFCVFDKCVRTSKAIDVLNNSKTSFDCKFEFEINGKSYFIERHAKKSPKRGTVKVDADFYTYNSDGSKESLNGDERRDTNSIIRNYVGSFDDFILTALSTQSDNDGFIKKSQKDRKELLAQFLDMDVFEELYKLANDEFKELATLLKNYKNRNLDEKLNDSKQSLKDESDKLHELNDKMADVISRRTVLNNELEVKLSSKRNIDSSIVDVDTLTNNSNSLKTKIINKTDDYHRLVDSIESYKDELKELKSNINKYDVSDLKIKHDKFNEYTAESVKLKSKLQLVKMDIDHKQNHLDGIGSLTFDDNCSHCYDNKNTPFAKESVKLTTELVDLNDTKEILESEIENLSELIQQYNVTDTLNKCLKLHDSIEDTNNIIEKELLKEKSCDLELASMKSDYLSLIDKIEVSKKQQVDMNFNKDLNVQLTRIKCDISDLNDIIERISDDSTESRGDIKVHSRSIDDITESLNELRDMEAKYNGYEYYLKCVKRDGIPYKLISDILPKIEDEINNILSSIVEFKVILNTDGKNINSYIAYSDEEYWPLELTSGMEKFISSIAIRSALINISNLPRPNFITIDEGFSTLDSHNFNSLYLLFDYLKSQFEFIVTISHIDKTRDMVDQIIDIEKKEGFSHIRYL